MKAERETGSFLQNEKDLFRDILMIAKLNHEDAEQISDNLILKTAIRAKESIEPTPSDQKIASPKDLKDKGVSVADYIKQHIEKHKPEEIEIAFAEAAAITLSELDSHISPTLNNEQRFQISQRVQQYLNIYKK